MSAATDTGKRIASAALSVALTVTVSIGGALAGPVPAVSAPVAGGEPPTLPRPTSGCVGDSPVVATRPPWALGRMAPQHVWPLTRGRGAVVAVLDTGVSARAGGLTGNAVEPGTNVVQHVPAYHDCAGRGTALAGIVAARPVSGSPFVGVAPEATVLPIGIVDGDGKIPPGAIAKGIRAATAAGADVILLGVGTDQPDAGLRSAVQAAVRHDIVLVASVSDQEQLNSTQKSAAWYPASDDHVLAVGGVGPDGVPTEKLSPRDSVDLLAPGAEAISVAPTGHGHYSVGGPAVAAAYVAGAAALVRAYYPRLDEEEVRRRLELTAEHPLGKLPDPVVGYGTLDLYHAVTALDLHESTLPPARPAPVVLPAKAPANPATLIGGIVSAGTVAAAAVAYISAVAIRWGRRRRWHA